MGTDNLSDKTMPDAVVDSAVEQAAPATPSGAVDTTGQAGRIFRGLLQGVAEIDLWVQAGHTPACFGLTEDSAALADSFIAGVNAIPDHMEDAARLIKGCAICTEVLKSTVEDMGGTLPQAWQELEPASLENLPEELKEEDAALPPKQPIDHFVAILNGAEEINVELLRMAVGMLDMVKPHEWAKIGHPLELLGPAQGVTNVVTLFTACDSLPWDRIPGWLFRDIERTKSNSALATALERMVKALGGTMPREWYELEPTK